MATTVHLFQWVAAFAVAAGFTGAWLLRPPTQRWRHLAIGITGSILWIPVAYLSNNVYVLSDAGQKVPFGSEALVGVGTLMVVINILGTILGLVLWVEETADETEDSLPRKMQHRRGD
jgi:nitric oxide reductase large subunit